MAKAEYIEGDLQAGVSLGLEYKYRYIHYKGKFVIYDDTDGKIIEHIKNQGNDYLTEYRARKRLHEINGVEFALSDEIRAELDAES